MGVDWQPFFLSFQLAAVTTVVLFLLGVPLAAWLAHTSSPLKPVLEAVLSLPLVLPPSVLGFYLLLFLVLPMRLDIGCNHGSTYVYCFHFQVL